MLGKYLRSKIAIVLAVLGLVILGLGIGQRTIWLPPATVTAAVQGDIAAAPLTVIDPAVLNANGGKYTMTVKAKGPIQLAVGQQRDVMAWVGNAAYTSISGVADDFSTLTAASKTGEAKVPNPKGSDLWVSEQDANGSLSYTWQSPGTGKWSVLLSSDGTAAAPTEISLTRANDQSTPWAIPLMVLGSALLAIAALFFWIAPRKPQEAAAAVGGRRAAGRHPADPATGAMEVARIVAAREAAQSDSPVPDTASSAEPTHATIAEANLAARAAAGNPVIPESADQETAVHPVTSAPSESSLVEPDDAPSDESDAHSDSGSDSNSDDDGTPGSSVPDQESSMELSEDAKATGETKQDGKTERRSFGSSLKVRLGAIVTAALLAIGIAPAMADESPTPSASSPASSPASSSASASSSAASTADAGQPDGDGASIPELLLSQVERIAADLATVVASGDSAKNAKELDSRVTGLALQTRDANYKIRAKDGSYAAPEPVVASKLLTFVSPDGGSWPRTAIVVTKGADNPLPQLLVLMQQSARENYKLSQQSPLLPGQTFPQTEAGSVKSLSTTAKGDLLMSPADAVSAMGDVLSNSASKSKASFADSFFITENAKYRQSIVDLNKEANVTFSVVADKSTVSAVQTADGGALVVAGFTFAVDSSAKDQATIEWTDKSIITLAGGDKSTKGVVVTQAQPVVLYVPPASAKKQIVVTSGARDLISAKIK